ncbi:MAG: hypothetical protein VX941_06080 [Pseudomonadota bacterium]|nr:hypothetical protein [Pseudomonadota bacterium]
MAEGKKPEQMRAISIVASAAAYWSDIELQHPAAEYLAAQLSETRKGYADVRGTMAFEDEPSSFVAAIFETRDTGE